MKSEKLLCGVNRITAIFFSITIFIHRFVCEVKLFEMLLDVFSKSREKDVINGIIGFYNMLLTNLSKQQTINYLLSHPCIIAMQLTKFGNMGN
jgi:ABC-type multidrug transport system permease subunit